MLRGPMLNSPRTRLPDAVGRSKGLDPFSTGVGVSLIGLGLCALAAVEAASLLLARDTAAPRRESMTGCEPELGAWTAAPMEVAGWDAPADPQNAIGTGPAAPRTRDRVTAPAPSGSVIGIAATPIPNGSALYRLWSSGAIEAMITTEANIWSEWTSVVPGQTTEVRRPRAPSDNPDTEP